MPEVDIIWPEEDIKAIDKAIQRSVLQGKRDTQGALIQAGVYLARSASGATNSAPKKRRVYTNREQSGQWNKRRMPYYREVWKGGPDNTIKWYLKTKGQTDFETIKRAGLAKNSWRWMIPGIRRRGGGNFAQEVMHFGRGLDYEIHMHNKLSYIRKALKRQDDGQSLLMMTLGKAARQLEKDTDRRFERIAK